MEDLKDYHGKEAGTALLTHMKWIAERYERMNEQLISLSGTFIGFLAVELALLAQINKSDFENRAWIAHLGIFCIVSLVSSLMLFFLTLRSIDFELPLLEDFKKAILLDKKELEKAPLRLMLSTSVNNANLQNSLEEENELLNKFYRPALLVGFIGQVLLAILVVALWSL